METGCASSCLYTSCLDPGYGGNVAYAHFQDATDRDRHKDVAMLSRWTQLARVGDPGADQDADPARLSCVVASQDRNDSREQALLFLCAKGWPSMLRSVCCVAPGAPQNGMPVATCERKRQ